MLDTLLPIFAFRQKNWTNGSSARAIRAEERIVMNTDGAGGEKEERIRMQRTTVPRTNVAGLARLAPLGVFAFLDLAASVFFTILSSALIALALEPFVQFFCRKA